MDNDKRDFDEYQPGGADGDHEQIDCMEGAELDMDRGKTLLIELDRLERELKSLDFSD